jgi:hydroxymethylpyrimidine pyrophosphatase-like HAD family hydrolase
MNKETKLLICDIDGTLCEKGRDPLPLTKRVLEVFHEKGVF